MTNRYLEEGVGSGTLGYVIETYPAEVYEVEFSDENGISVAQLVLNADEITLAERE